MSVDDTSLPGGPPPAPGTLRSCSSILVRGLPDDVHGALQQRAEQRGQSLQQYLTYELTRLVERPTAEELFARIDQRFSDAIDDLEDLDLTRYPTLPLMRRAFDLRANVTAHDAVYVALAERLDCTLVTADHRLAAAPTISCTVDVLHP